MKKHCPSDSQCGFSVITEIIFLRMILGNYFWLDSWVEKAMKTAPSACPSASDIAVCTSLVIEAWLEWNCCVLFIRSWEKWREMYNNSYFLILKRGAPPISVNSISIYLLNLSALTCFCKCGSSQFHVTFGLRMKILWLTKCISYIYSFFSLRVGLKAKTPSLHS